MGNPFCTTTVCDRFRVSLFSECVSIQDKQRFAFLGFVSDKIFQIGVNCNNAMLLTIYVFHYQKFLNYYSILRLKN